MDLQLQGKLIIVSGGAKGIGEGIARSLASEDAMPVIIGRNETDNRKLVQSLKDAGGQADFVTADLVEPTACALAIQTVLQHFVLCCCFF